MDQQAQRGEYRRVDGRVDTGDDFDPWASISNSWTEHTEAIATLEEIAALNSSPAYLADIQDMVTVPRRDCACYGEELVPYTDILAGIQCPFTTHYHYLNTSVIRPKVVIGESKGTIYYTPVIVDRIGALMGIRWMTGPDYLFSIDYYEMALCALNTSSGNVVKLWGSGNIKDGLPAGPGGLFEAYIEFDFDPPQITTPGQILFVAHQQTAPEVCSNRVVSPLRWHRTRDDRTRSSMRQPIWPMTTPRASRPRSASPR